MSKISNGQLVAQLRSGDRRGCEHLLRIYQAKLVHLCVFRFSANRPDAEEIVNDVLIAVMQNIATFTFKRSDSDFHYWVMTIFRNKVRDFFRRQLVMYGSTHPSWERIAGPGDGSEGAGLARASLAQYERTLDEQEGEGQLLDGVSMLLAEIAPWERVLLQCRADKMPYGDIARFTGKSVDQLKVYYPRVRKKFQRLLLDRFPDLEERFGNGEAPKKNNAPQSGRGGQRRQSDPGHADKVRSTPARRQTR